MTKNLKWRLGKLPTPEEVQTLIKDEIITKEEGRSILFSEESEKEVTEENLKSEIKFLRELIDKLANKHNIVETIKYIEKPYYDWTWYKPYSVYCSSAMVSDASTQQLAGTFSGNTNYPAVDNLVGYAVGGTGITDLQTF